MEFTFEPIDIKQQADYEHRYQISQVPTSDYTFINLWGWADEYQLEWAWSDQLTWIRQNYPKREYWAPMGDWKKVDWPSQYKFLPQDATEFIRVPQKLAHIWLEQLPCPVHIQETRGQWDYLYDLDELAKLKGNRFHKKKNLVNQFKKKYNYSYLEFGNDMITKALQLQQDWCTWKDCEANETLAMENRVIERVLRYGTDFKQLLGGALLVDERLVSYTIAEAVFNNSLIIHFEKGNPDFKGSYQAINQIFLEQSGQGYQYVNREQDIDDPGLRQAKLSYNPVGFIEKDRVTLG